METGRATSPLPPARHSEAGDAAEAQSSQIAQLQQQQQLRAQAEALKQNPNLIELRKVERWDGSVPQWNGTGPLPLLNLSGGPVQQPQQN